MTKKKFDVKAARQLAFDCDHHGYSPHEWKLTDTIRDACKRIEELEAVLVTLRQNHKLWKSGGIGGQDQYAGCPPGFRLIDVVVPDAAYRALSAAGYAEGVGAQGRVSGEGKKNEG